MANKTKNTAEKIGLFVTVSVLLHILMSLGIYYSNKIAPPQPTKVEITLIDHDPNKIAEEERLMVVEQPDKQYNDQISEDAKYLSRYNQKVIKETRAEKTGDFKNTSAQKAKAQKAPKIEKAEEPNAHPSFADLKPRLNNDITTTEDSPEAKAEEASQTNDYLKDVDKGVETLLNAREFVFYSYYQRIRERIRQQWEPKIREKVRKIFSEGRSIASSGDKITRVIIILDTAGSLVNVQVVGESGVSDLDDAAIEAFKAAEPFPNPPKGIIDSDGKIRIRWDFVLEAA